MNIKLLNIHIENFKGLKEFTAHFNGENTTIKGVNGSGKTTVYDTFLWLLFGKDSTGRKDFDLRPLDKDNNPVPKLVLCVETEISFDGVSHTLKKEHHEKHVKNQLRGYETLCWIDDVPKKVSEFSEFIEELVPEDTFKLLTDLHHFNSKLHWTDRRAVLMDIAGKIGTPQGFDELLAALNGRKIDDYKKVLADQKTRLIKERDEINPRIDEIQRGLEQYAASGEHTPQLAFEVKRSGIEKDIKTLDEQRQDILSKEQERQAKIDRLNTLKSERSQREIKLASLGLVGVNNEKAEIEAGVEKQRQELRNARSAMSELVFQIEDAQKKFDRKLAVLNDVRLRHKLASEKPIPDLPPVELPPAAETSCYACGQKLPASKIAEVEQIRKNKITEAEQARQKKLAELQKQKESDIAALVQEGVQAKSESVTLKQSLDALIAKKAGLQENIEKAQIKVQEAEAYKQERFNAMAQIEKTNKVNPATDPEWVDLEKQIAELEKSIGQPASFQLSAIEKTRSEKQAALVEINRALANSDTMKKNATRIKELEAKEKELSQQIADTEKLLADIDGYKKRESEMIEAAVNGKFRHVTFKLFDVLLNGSIEPTCVALLNGKPYLEMSTGEKIVVGVDIINVLSEHYGYSIPLFVDNRESLTLPLESNSQTISLVADVKVKKLKVEQAAETVAA